MKSEGDDYFRDEVVEFLKSARGGHLHRYLTEDQIIEIINEVIEEGETHFDGPEPILLGLEKFARAIF